MAQFNSRYKKPQPRIVRKPEVLATLGISRSTLFNRINAGLHPPSIPLGGRAVGWLESEVQCVLNGLVSGLTTEEKKDLVINLIEKRNIIKRLIK
jgi:prophage regulatory protein